MAGKKQKNNPRAGHYGPEVLRQTAAAVRAAARRRLRARSRRQPKAALRPAGLLSGVAGLAQRSYRGLRAGTAEANHRRTGRAAKTDPERRPWSCQPRTDGSGRQRGENPIDHHAGRLFEERPRRVEIGVAVAHPFRYRSSRSAAEALVQLFPAADPVNGAVRREDRGALGFPHQAAQFWIWTLWQGGSTLCGRVL